ncbi:MAG: PD-(D/E)XK nuclease-like domain-containing protein [Clostridiaceae bacterium]
MILTAENYHLPEMNMKYMGSSQFKAFMECEAMALAEAKGEYIREKTVSLMVGSYVDAYYEGTLDRFMTENPDIFIQKGPLKADYKHAEYIIRRLERDEMFQEYMSGKKQVIKTGMIMGIPFKIKIDSYHEGNKIVDLKIMKDFEGIWKDGLKLSFVEAWGYDIQAAIYQFVEGNNLPFYIAGATKEKPEPDLAIISIPQDRLDYCLGIVTDNVQRFADIKKGLIVPTRCGHCDYCKSTKVLTEVVDYTLIGA